MENSQIIEAIDTGIIILDGDFKVVYWNGWMSAHTQIDPSEIVGRALFDHFPHLKNHRFLRNCQSVLTFGHLAFFPQDPYGYLFSMRPVEWYRQEFQYMQQSCTVGPIRDDQQQITHLFISVQDMTEDASYQKKLIKLSQRDALTGAYNRRFLREFLQEELYRCQRYHRPMSVIMMDVDFFKKLNDRYGHPFGDEVLRTIVSEITKKMRKTNRLARYGGEEFCIVLPETNESGAMCFSEKIRKMIEALVLYTERIPVKITASFGVSTLSEETKNLETLLEKADQALYRAKQSGRNQTVVSH
ncbi:MAG: diguanylate cyclase [Nitrospiria bacterium]